MSYIGKEPQFTQYPSKFFNGDGTAMTVSLDYAPPNAAALLVFIDGVRQDTSAYTLSGTSLTFTGTVPSGTNNVQVVHLGLTQDVGVPSDDTISTDKLQDDSVTAAKLNATGTASSSTFLRGDMAWTAVSDTSGLASVQTFTSSGTWTRPSGITKVVVEVQGAGGSGSDGQAGNNKNNNGGSGGYVKKLLDVSSISSATITIGTGGTGVENSYTGNDGGDSSWVDGINTLTGGGGGGPVNTDNYGGIGGTATGGDINIVGQNGGGYAARRGADSMFGYGGDWGNFSGSGGTSTSRANVAVGYGAGGCGVYDGLPSNGSNGIVIVWEYK